MSRLSDIIKKTTSDVYQGAKHGLTGLVTLPLLPASLSWLPEYARGKQTLEENIGLRGIGYAALSVFPTVLGLGGLGAVIKYTLDNPEVAVPALVAGNVVTGLAKALGVKEKAKRISSYGKEKARNARDYLGSVMSEYVRRTQGTRG